MPEFRSYGFSKLLAIALACAAAGPALAELPRKYRLAAVGGPLMRPLHINKNGLVAGGLTNGSHTETYPVLWNQGEVEFLGRIPNQRGGNAFWVNASGVASGGVADEYGTPYAIVWSGTGEATNLTRVVPDARSVPAINDIGNCVIQGEQLYLSLGCTGSNLIQIDGGFKRVTSVAGINSNNEVAGTAVFKGGGGNDARAFLYTNGKMQKLSVLPGYGWCYGYGLTGRGHVVGSCGGNKFRLAGFFWNGRKLTMIPNAFGGNRWAAYAINYDDVVVGLADDGPGWKHPFIIDMRARQPRMLDLSKMVDSSADGWTIENAVGINTAGQILVRGHVEGEVDEQSAILTPIE